MKKEDLEQIVIETKTNLENLSKGQDVIFDWMQKFEEKQEKKFEKIHDRISSVRNYGFSLTFAGGAIAGFCLELLIK
jgi:hypothetical protein